MTPRTTLGLVALLIAVIAGAQRLAVRTLIVAGNAALHREDVPAAERLYRQALDRRPGSGPAYLGLGAAAFRAQRYEAAMQEFERAAARPGSTADRVRAHYNLGNALFALGRLEAALEAYKTALRLDPSDEDARYNLALIWQRREKERAPAPSMSSRRAEQLVGALGRPRIRVSGQPGSPPPRPGPGAGPTIVDK